MNAKELMISDWVLHEGEPYQIRQLGIFGVDRDGEDYPAVCIGKPNGIGIILERNEIEPIPLTPEILEKNGFKKKGYRYGIYDDYFDFEMHEYNDGTWLVSYHCCEMSLPDEQLLICYIHQLQHFMRHCGIEKEIEL